MRVTLIMFLIIYSWIFLNINEIFLNFDVTLYFCDIQDRMSHWCGLNAKILMKMML